MKFVNKSLIKGSIVLLIAFNLFNFLNFIFHFFMARLLTVAEFGILATLFSIIYILGGFTDSIQVVITKYTASQKNNGKLNYILRKSLRGAFFVSLVLFLVYLLVAIFISKITGIDYLLVAFTGVIIFASFSIPVTRGMLQGKKKFKSLGLNMILEATIKLAVALVLTFWGWGVFGNK